MVQILSLEECDMTELIASNVEIECMQVLRLESSLACIL
jgi:hypothetical protein